MFDLHIFTLKCVLNTVKTFLPQIQIWNKKKTFSFTTNQSFNLEEVTSLIYKDVKEGALL